MRFFTMCLATSLLVAPAVAPAQTLADLTIGDRVRVTTEGVNRREAIFDGLRGDTIALRVAAPDGAGWFVQYGQVQRFEVRRPDAASKAVSGALAGTVIGFGVVYAVFRYVVSDCSYECGENSFFSALLSIPGGVVGGIVGWFLGHTKKVDGWRELPLPLRITP